MAQNRRTGHPEAEALVDELRRLGQDPELVNAALNRLELEDLQHSERFRRSLEQMRRGERAQWPEGWDI